MNKTLIVLAASVAALGGAPSAHAANMTSTTVMLQPSDTNSGGDDAAVSASNYRLGSALGEAVAGPKMASSTNYKTGSGLRELLSYPNVINGMSVDASFSATQVLLQWSAPGYDGATGALQPGTSYYVVIATYTVPNPFIFNNYSVSFATSGTSPGDGVGYRLGGLVPSTTYYVHLFTRDADGNLSFISNRSTFTTIPPLVGLISDVLGNPGIAKAFLSWKFAATPGEPSPLSRFNIYRSTEAAASFVVVATTTVEADIDKFLTPHTTYFYKITAVNTVGTESAFSPTAAVDPFNVPPQEPFGLVAAATPSTMGISWSTTTRWADTSLFDSTGTPDADELGGYQVFRATGVCAPMTLLATKPISITSHTDVTGGGSFFYAVRSFNSEGASTGTVVLDTVGRQYFTADDCLTQAVLATEQAALLNKSGNAFGQDILLARARRPQDVGGKVVESFDIRPLLGGATEVANFHFPRPATIQLHYAAAAGGKDLGTFWFNGVEFKKLYGTVDQAGRTVTVQTPNLGTFQVRTVFRDLSAATFDLSNITSRVFTPNGDGLNDAVIFLFDNPRSAAITGKIYDMRGMHVADMTPGPLPNSLQWDGRSGGRAVTSGAYVYQVQGDGKSFNGTIVAAR